MKPKNTYTHLLLDWDGCLANTLSIWMQAYKDTFAQYNLFPSEEEISEKAFGDFEGPSKLGVSKNEEFIKKLRVKADKKLPKPDLNPHVKETLINLREKNKRMCVVTSSRKKVVGPAMLHTGINEFSDFLITSDNVSKIKPDPEIIYTAMEMFGVNDKSKVLIVGDGDKDIEAGRNAGIDTCLFFPENNKAIYDLEFLKELEPTYFIRDFRELAKIVI